jgi:hypothetical protein
MTAINKVASVGATEASNCGPQPLVIVGECALLRFSH